MRIAIIGAGISGLSTAFYLQRGRPDCELLIFDANPAPGGTMCTVECEGFRFEAGGNGFLTNKPDSLQLVKDAGAGHLQLPGSELARKRYIFTDRLHRLPETPPAFLVSRLLSLPQKLRVAAEVFIPPKRDDSDETLQGFGYRRVGKAFTDVFLDAMTAGIYATTPGRVSVNAAFPLVVQLERDYGGLFRGMFARRKRQAGPGGILMSFQGGVGRFIDHLQSLLRADWRLGTAVSGILRDAGGYRVLSAAGEVHVDQVVVSATAPAAAAMLRGLDADLASRLAAVEYSPLAVVGFGYRHLDHPLDGFGLLTTTGRRTAYPGCALGQQHLSRPRSCRQQVPEGDDRRTAQSGTDAPGRRGAAGRRARRYPYDHGRGYRAGREFREALGTGHPELPGRTSASHGRAVCSGGALSRSASELQCLSRYCHERLRTQQS